MQRRTLELRTAEEVIQEIESLRSGGYERTGRWTLTQVCEHLTATMDGGMDGFGFRLPWILRATVVRWAFQRALKKRKLPSGAPTFRSLKPASDSSTDDDNVINACLESCRRAGEFSGSLEDYALLDNLSVDQWRDFMWIHASHHLGFLIPKTS